MVVEEQRWRATDGGGRMRVGVVNGGGLAPNKNYNRILKKQKQHSSPKNNNTYAMESINVCIM